MPPKYSAPVDGYKTCVKCNVSRPVEDFRRDKRSVQDRLTARCKPCMRADDLARHHADPLKLEKSRANYQRNAVRLRASSKAAHIALRLEVYTAICGGTPLCACCGETEMGFLTIDHIDGGGGHHRQQVGSKGPVGVLYYLRRHGYPPGYQILCYNCNCAKEFRGECPHETARRLVNSGEKTVN